MAIKVPVRLEHAAGLSKQLVDRLPPGQAHWWLRGPADFIRLPRRVRGDQPLDQTVQLEPGTYTIGVGPPSRGVRQTLVVEAPEEPAAGTPVVAAPLPVTGKTFVLTGDLDAMDRDAAKAWLVGLGAKVSTSVSSKTDYVLVGRDPGPKRLEQAAELGTRIVTESELRASLGMPEAPPPAPAASAAKPDAGGDPLAKFIAKCDLRKLDLVKIGKLVGPSHFRDLGLHAHQLWGISIGPRGGEYAVYIDLAERPKHAMQCNCSQTRPCQHAYALLITAQKHAAPPAPPPDGHEAQARYRPTWE